MTAPAHIVHGSSVTTSVHPSSRHWPRAAAAWRTATISACAVGSPSASCRLCPAPITAPASSSTTAPTGTSSLAEAAAAWSRARRIAGSHDITWANLRAECAVERALQRRPEAQPARDALQDLVGEHVQVPGERPEFHLVDAEVGQDREVPGRKHLVEVVIVVGDGYV